MLVNVQHVASYQLKEALPFLNRPELATVGNLSLNSLLECAKKYPFYVASTVASLLWMLWQKRIASGTVLELDLEGLTIKESASPLSEIIDGEPAVLFLLSI